MASRPPIDPVDFIKHYLKGKDAMILQLKNVRLAFPNLWVPTAFEEGQEKKYSATLLIPKNDPQHKMIQDAIKEVAQAEWKNKTDATLKSIENIPQKYCYMDGDGKALDGYAGHFALSAKSKKRVPVKDRDTSALSEADEKPYAGCYVNASVEIWAQGGKHAGMRCQLRGIQFVRDGDQFTAGSVANDDEFEDLGNGADAEDDLA